MPFTFTVVPALFVPVIVKVSLLVIDFRLILNPPLGLVDGRAEVRAVDRGVPSDVLAGVATDVERGELVARAVAVGAAVSSAGIVGLVVAIAVAVGRAVTVGLAVATAVCVGIAEREGATVGIVVPFGVACEPIVTVAFVTLVNSSFG